MMGKSYNNGSSPSQSSICYEVYGNYNDQRANASTFEEAIEYATGKSIKAWPPYRSFSKMQDYIEADYPFVMSSYYHAKFYFGYITDSSGSERLYLVDPINGQMFLENYDDAVSGVKISFFKYSIWLG